MKKLILCASALLLTASAFAQSNYYEGDGGKGISIEVVQPKITGNVTDESKWFPDFAANMIHDDMEKYSAITMIDSTNIDTQMEIDDRNLNSGMFEGASELSYKAAQNTLFINLAVTPAGYNLSVRVNQSNTSKASHNKNYSVSDMNSGLALKTATADILEQMGVKLTAQGKKELLAVETSKGTIEAQKLNAQAKMAEESGNNLAALTYLVQAKKSDAKLTRTSNALGKLSAMVASGNVGEKARNLIQIRKDFIKLLEEAENYFNTENPYTLVYNPEPELGEVDYKRELMQVKYNLVVFTDPEAFNIATTIQSSFITMPDKDNWGISHRVENLGEKNLCILLNLCSKDGKVIEKNLFDHWGDGGSVTLSPYKAYTTGKSFFFINANIDTDGMSIKIEKTIDSEAVYHESSYYHYKKTTDWEWYRDAQKVENELSKAKSIYKTFSCITPDESLPLFAFRKIQINPKVAFIGIEKKYYEYKNSDKETINRIYAYLGFSLNIHSKMVAESYFPEIKTADRINKIKLSEEERYNMLNYKDFGYGYIITGVEPNTQEENNPNLSRYEAIRDKVINEIADEQCWVSKNDFKNAEEGYEATFFTLKDSVVKELESHNISGEAIPEFLMKLYRIVPEEDGCTIKKCNFNWEKRKSVLCTFEFNTKNAYELRNLSGKSVSYRLALKENLSEYLELIGSDFFEYTANHSTHIIFRLPKKLYDSLKDEYQLPDYESVPASKISKKLKIALDQKYPYNSSRGEKYFCCSQIKTDKDVKYPPSIQAYVNTLDLKNNKNMLIFKVWAGYF